MLCQRRRIHLIYRETADLVRICCGAATFLVDSGSGLFLKSQCRIRLSAFCKTRGRTEIQIQIRVTDINSDPDLDSAN